MAARRLFLPLAGLVAAWIILGCNAGPRTGARSSPEVASADRGPLDELDGYWESEGYGYQYEILKDGSFLASQVTSVSCIPAWRAPVVSVDGQSVTYRRLDSSALFVLRRDGVSERVRIHPTQTASEIIAHRLPGPLPICMRPTPDTPPSNFDVFAATFAEHYPFFAQRGVDWPTVVAEARARVSDRTKPSALFDILTGMIAPLNDAHTLITAPRLDGPDDGRGYAGFRLAAGAVDPDDFGRVRALVERYLTRPIQLLCEKQLAFGMLPDDMAYLRIHAFAQYTPNGSFESDAAALELALDTVFADAQRWRGLVIDVRTNEGGADPLGLVIAARLTASEYVAYAKQARADARDPTRWTPEMPSVVRPSSRPGFRGSVILLTGPDTISAGETFTQALIERRPAVDRVGRSTQGVFSDVMGRHLPNGWIVGVPNERFVTRGKSYDVTGIPPTIDVPLYTAADLAAGRDAALEVAMNRLRTAAESSSR